MTVKVWMPALPPMPATTGMKTARAATAWIDALEEADDARGQDRRRQVHEEPGEPPADGLRRRVEDRLVGGDAAEPVDVLGRLLVDDVDHVVDRDRAQEAVVPVDHRHREEVVPGDEPRDLLLVGVGGDAHHLVRRIACTVVAGSAVMSRRSGTRPTRWSWSSTT